MSLIGSHWALSQSWIPMGKLRPLHNNFLLTALNEDFVMCITAIFAIQQINHKLSKHV